MNPFDIGSILINLGACTVDDVRTATQAQLATPDVRLGEMLLAAGAITTEQLRHALSIQADIHGNHKVRGMMSMLTSAAENVRASTVRKDATLRKLG